MPPLQLNQTIGPLTFGELNFLLYLDLHGLEPQTILNELQRTKGGTAGRSLAHHDSLATHLSRLYDYLRANATHDTLLVMAKVITEDASRDGWKGAVERAAEALLGREGIRRRASERLALDKYRHNMPSSSSGQNAAGGNIIDLATVTGNGKAKIIAAYEREVMGEGANLMDVNEIHAELWRIVNTNEAGRIAGRRVLEYK